MAADLDALRTLLAGAGRLLIVTHDNPDPDALMAAFALSRVAHTLANVTAKIVCNGYVGRAENRALKRELHIKLAGPARLNWRKWPRIALVDAQPGTGNNCFPPHRIPDICIDHHPLRRKTRARYLDVRPTAGACATLLVEYLELAQTDITDDLAAGLCYAISSETQDFARDTSPKDAAAYAALYLKADKKKLARILHPPLKHTYYTILSHALLAAFTYGNIIGSHLGEVDHPDSVSLVADLLLRRERNTWSIVTGIWRNELYISLRTHNRTAHAGRTLRRLLGAAGRAGGHDQIAGGQAPLKGLDAPARKALQDNLVQQLIKLVRRRADVPLKHLITPEELGRIRPAPPPPPDQTPPENTET